MKRVDFTPCSYYSAWHDRWFVETLFPRLQNNLVLLVKTFLNVFFFHVQQKHKLNYVEGAERSFCFFLFLAQRAVVLI